MNRKKRWQGGLAFLVLLLLSLAGRLLTGPVAENSKPDGGEASTVAGNPLSDGGEASTVTGNLVSDGGEASTVAGNLLSDGGEASTVAGNPLSDRGEEVLSIEEDGTYTDKDQVALYLHTYGRLPGNYISKKEAEALGWEPSKGNLWELAPGKSIGGSRFGNYEGLLPEEETYRECDIDYEGGYRGEKRLVYSDRGLIFYTGDHYQSFEQLYDEEGRLP